MVFLTSILIVCILYFMQERGLIFVTIIALVAEVMNISMTHIISKSTEKKVTEKFLRIVDKYKAKIIQMKKRNVILEGQREDDTNALYDATEKNRALEVRIKDYEKANTKLTETIKNQQGIIENLEDLPKGSSLTYHTELEPLGKS